MGRYQMSDEKEEPVSPAPSTLEVNDVLAAYRLSWLANFMSGPLYAELETSIGLSRPEFIVLLNCHHRPGNTAQEICLATGRPKNSISRAVIALQRAERLIQRRDATDGRLRRLHLTPKGETLYLAIIPKFVARERQMLAPLAPDERRHFERLLEKLVRRDDDWAQVF